MTRDELKAIKDLFKQQREEILSEIDTKISLLPTKEEFFSKMDEVMGELKANREDKRSKPEEFLSILMNLKN